ncbi:MAG: methyltransferase domain-containing protein [Planctomycetes bacterium]|nr:methyltransferase domain-containing protein [Planctomycetota bacterium]
MGNYLETFYSRNEQGEDNYPQQLCDHLVEQWLGGASAVRGKKLLDIGSGKGNHLIGFARRGMETYGIDKRSECLGALDQFDIRDCDIESEPFPFEDGFFDYVYSKSVLEHVTNTDNFLAQALRVLKPGGTALIMTPDWKSQHTYFWDDYTHVRAFTRKSLQNAMIINGFNQVKCDYFLQLPMVWKHPWVEPFTRLVALLPDSLRWKDAEEKEFRRLIRFSKERMLISSGRKTAT